MSLYPYYKQLIEMSNWHVNFTDIVEAVGRSTNKPNDSLFTYSSKVHVLGDFLSIICMSNLS